MLLKKKPSLVQTTLSANPPVEVQLREKLISMDSSSNVLAKLTLTVTPENYNIDIIYCRMGFECMV